MKMQFNFDKERVGFWKRILLFFFSSGIYCNAALAQLPMIDPMGTPPQVLISKDTKTENRERLHRSLISGINRNLSLPLTDSTEENWMDAFYSIELLRYKSPWVELKMFEAFKGIENRSGFFQRSLMECVYDAYPDVLDKQVMALLDTTTDVKCFAICAEYLLKKNKDKHRILKKIAERKNQYSKNAVLRALWFHSIYTKQGSPPITDLLHHTFFPNAKVVFSFQRKNRNYPGLTIVRDSAGNFVKEPFGNIFSVAQLARSISNLPGYLSNGNTPQGIFRMYGFDESKSIFIGPTPNIQLTMPCETSVQHFMNDSTIADSVWTMEWYRELLPKSWKTYTPFYESFFAGNAGRTEIIAHGTTVDPSWYKNTSYYPLTPTLGCLCTKEMWSGENGRRTESDQQKLVDALTKAGGADGYYIVIELDDQQKPVTVEELLPLLQQKN